MLRHAEQPVEQDAAGQLRVSPDELTKALAAIDARRHKDSNDRENTISIGDAVRELSLEATPEEIRAEVEKQRANSTQQPKQRRFRSLGLSIIVGCLAYVALLGAREQGQQTPLSSVTLSASPSMLVQDNMGRGNMLQTLGEVPENRPVRCMFDESQNSDLTSFTSNNDAWTLLKHSGKVYLRGWTMQMSEMARQQAGQMAIYNQKPTENGVRFVPITLPLDAFKCISEQSGNFELVATDIHLDQHAWEKW